MYIYNKQKCKLELFGNKNGGFAERQIEFDYNTKQFVSGFILCRLGQCTP